MRDDSDTETMVSESAPEPNSVPHHADGTMLPIPHYSLPLLSSEQEAALMRARHQELANSSGALDLSSVITNIIHYGEQVDSMYGYENAIKLPLGASLKLKTQSLPILDNLVGLAS